MEHLLETPSGIEGRAKIIWGDSPETVFNFLAQTGLSREEIDYIIEDALEERREGIREAGKILLQRAGISLVCAIVLLFVYWPPGVICFLYSIILLMVGLPRFLSGNANGDVGKMTGMFG